MDPTILAMLMQQGQNTMGGASQFLSGLFGNSGAPYKDYGQQYQKYAQQGINAQNPFYNAGTGAISNFQNWANGQQNPSQFINSLMNQYQQSPWAKFQLQQGQNTANNAASASGLIGSTPFMQASQNYAQGITSQDQQNWLANVLGINQNYGAAENQLMTGGQNAANQITNAYNELGKNMGAAAYGEEAGKNYDTGNEIGGALKFLFG